MWRRQSGGASSGAQVGNDQGAATIHRTEASNASSNVAVITGGQSCWLSQQQTTPRRCDSSELADSPIRAEAVKLVRDLNRAVATHVALATLLGGSGDGPHLRDELRRARRTAQEAAAAAKATLLPALLDQKWAEKERSELERLWHLLLCCLDSLETSMQKSLVLLREFSLAEGSNTLIHTGCDGVNNNHSHHHPPHHHHHHHHHHLHHTRSHSDHHRGGGGNSCEVGDVPLLDKIALEGVEASQLCKELFELRAQLLELKSAVELRYLLSPSECFVIEEEFASSGDGGVGCVGSRSKTRRTITHASLNGTTDRSSVAQPSSISCSLASEDKESIESDLESQATGITSAQRRCVCLILAFMITVFILAMVLGILVALIS